MFTIFGEKVYATESMLATWCVMAILITVAVIVRIKVKSFKDVPSGFQTAIETAVEMMSNLAKSVLGDKMEYLGGYFFAVFAFIITANYSGIIGFRPPTSDIATTLPLALSTFFLIHFAGIKFQKAEYFKEYLKPIFFFAPINLIGELSRPVSLAFRLFGNILGGLIILQLIYTMPPIFFKFALPSVLHGYFDLFAGALQAFVFTVLSLTFISLKTET
ncbi:MAG: F0F1 ATP synthase subunit A [Oscillospiraceae bacterium]|nr:F0F1 ATP synthase subunit A [Oscillospiraceae bacterium]